MQRNETIREFLRDLPGDTRFNFEATFERKGFDKRFSDKETILLTNIFLIEDNGNKIEVTDHNWVIKSKRWNNALKTLKSGDKIKFTAEIKKYYKEGKKEYFEDYGLVSLRNIIKNENN